MEALGELVAGIAHDFNNVLSILSMRIELMMRPNYASMHDVQRDAEMLLHTLDRASSLTHQLLAYGRQEGGKKSTHAFDSMVSGLREMLRRVLGEQIGFNVKLGAGASAIECEPGMIQQVVMNLCINARDAMPKGGTLTVDTRELSISVAQVAAHGAPWRNGRFVVLRVSDTGHGIDPAIVGKIFDPFFTTKAREKGTGLGLAMVKGIVAQHNGWIDVESRPKLGTTFSVYFPVSDSLVSASQTRSKPMDAPQGGARILLVEDEEDLRRIAARALQRLGYDLVETASPAEAKERWARDEGRFDLLLTDMVMPGGISGLELSRELRKSAGELKVVIVSGYNLELPQVADLNAERISFLSKPFDLQSLGATVRASLSGATSPSGAK
jgi:CheY-like chemotaxis protein